MTRRLPVSENPAACRRHRGIPDILSRSHRQPQSTGDLERLEEFDGDDVYGMGQEYDMYDAALRRGAADCGICEACGLAEEDDLIFDAGDHRTG